MSLSVDENGGSSSEDGKNCSRGHWRPAEDDKLKQLVEQFGPRNWNSIAEHIEGRTGKSCRLRWFNQLDPRINRKPFSEEEEERLLAAHRRYGNKWSLIARLFPGRTDNAVKNHYHVIIARKHRERPKRNDLGNNDSRNPNISNIFGKACRPRSERYDTQYGSIRSVVTRQEDDKSSNHPLSANTRRSAWFDFEKPQQPMRKFQPFGNSSSIAWDLDKQIIHSALATKNNHNNSNNNGLVRSKGFSLIDHHHHQQQQQQRRIVDDDSCFGISKLGIGYQSWKNNVLEFPFSNICASSSSYGNVKQPRTRAVLQHDHQSRPSNNDEESSSSSIHRKDVPFIDFLGVGIAS